MALNLLAQLPLGRYSPGDSWLHRLDPRLKLLGLPALVIATFAATSPYRLALLGVVGLALAWYSRAPARLWLRMTWALRFLFLFTLVLHATLSPGYTLFGQEWLSLDGLQLGARVCLQLLLALVFSSLLTLTSTPETLAASAAAWLGPLQPLGLPIRRWADNLVLVLGLIPVLQQEAAQLGVEAGQAQPLPKFAFEARLQRGGEVLTTLLLRMVDRADGLAVALVQGAAVVPGRPALPPWSRPRRRDLLGALALIATLLGYGWLP